MSTKNSGLNPFKIHSGVYFIITLHLSHNLQSLSIREIIYVISSVSQTPNYITLYYNDYFFTSNSIHHTMPQNRTLQ